MKKALVPFRRFGTFLPGEQRYQLVGQMKRIDHLVLGISGMHIASLYLNLGRSSVEVLVLQFSQLAAIHRICPLGAEFGHVKFIGSAPYLLVGSKSNPNLAVFNFRMIQKILHGGHYCCDPRLIISSQQCGTIGDNDIFPCMSEQFREIGRRHDHIFCFVQHNVVSIVIFNHPRIDVLAAHIGTGIEMGYKPDDRSIFACIGRQGRHQITIIIEAHIA